MTAGPNDRLQGLLRRSERALIDIAVEVSEGILDAQMPPDVEVGQKYYNDGDKVHLAVVIQRRDDVRNGLWVSIDGDPDKVVRLPIRAGGCVIGIRAHPDAPEFAVISIPGWLANGRTGEFARTPIVNAKWPQLFDRIQWTERQRSAWAAIRVWRDQMIDAPRVSSLKRRRLYYSTPRCRSSSW